MEQKPKLLEQVRAVARARHLSHKMEDVLSPTREDGIVRRHYTAKSTIQKAVRDAMQKAEIIKHGNCHTFRHSFATHLLENQ